MYLILLFSVLLISEEDKLVTSVQRNMNELAVALLCLQQNMAIPEISLPIHPLITN